MKLKLEDLQQACDQLKSRPVFNMDEIEKAMEDLFRVNPPYRQFIKTPPPKQKRKRRPNKTLGKVKVTY